MKIIMSLLLLFFSTLAIADVNKSVPDKLNGAWTLSVLNMKRESITTIKLRFTDKKANSCLGGNWHRIAVDSIKTKDKNFFPVKSLSYEIKDNRITIGRNDICDAYLHISGVLQLSRAEGEYFSFGWGSKTLGYFVLNKNGANGS